MLIYCSKKWHTNKNQEEAAECAKLLVNRIMKAKETHQKQIMKRGRLSKLRVSTSKSE
ncbi:rCG27995, partial [Rattus norvegicus]